ncbi:hypothetical protein VHEMI10360 [[Torrubiella] hemipterigena]|uniref:Uncharacterized protein n=1 Tax=[Torrubiella] hemipterigena TaxID=1531966 RepID=A0A0A1TS12_9HYPO|nr:hypothetical protein VHEMI10360 [[Torrubiella] hemipterigena]
MKLALLGSLTLAGSALANLDAAAIIKQIAPNSVSCAGATPDCRTANQVAPHAVHSMSHYGLYSPKEMAAVLALMAFESADFKYKHNVYPGRPGQGTANMQMPSFNLKYAQSIPAVKGKVAGIGSADGLPAAKLNEILALVTPDEYNFGSGPWFLATQCPGAVRDALKGNVDEGFKQYMACVGVAVTSERLAYFNRAKQAFHL